MGQPPRKNTFQRWRSIPRLKIDKKNYPLTASHAHLAAGDRGRAMQTHIKHIFLIR